VSEAARGHRIPSLLAVFSAAWLAAAVPACGKHVAAPVPGPRQLSLTILGVNDFHGAVDERHVMLQTSGGTTADVRVGGAGLVASYIDRMREEDPEGTLVLNAGDMWQGSMESNYFEGRPVVMVDNVIGYDAAALGNHEFDYGPVGPRALAVPSDSPEVRFGALSQRRKEARFPILAANVRALDPAVDSFQPSIILEKKGVRIGIIGLATEETPSTTQPPNLVGLAFDPPAPALIKAAADVRAAGAQVVIVVAHIGGECPRGARPEDATGCKKGEEVMRLLDALPPHTIDAFVAGHTHQFIANVIDGVPVIESGSYGQAIGRIRLDLDPASHAVLHATILAPQPVCRDMLVDTQSCAPPTKDQHPRPAIEAAVFRGGVIAPDPEVDRILAPFREEVAGSKSKVIGEAARAIGTGRDGPSEIGALVTDEMVAATKRYPDVPDADFAVQNSGGLRAGIPKGPITYGELYEVLPFDNVLATITVTGPQLEAVFTSALRAKHFFQSSGLSLEVAGEGDARTVHLFDLATGVRLSATRKYVVVWTDFLAFGGDGTRDALPGVTSVLHEKHLLREAVAEGLALRKAPLNATDAPLLDPKKPRVRK
jgi:5'-nucleotidase